MKNEPNWLWNYDGSIRDKYRVRMTLVFSGNEVSGIYFYATQLKDIQLSGRIIDGTDIVLDELDAAGKVVARFEGNFPERDPRGRYGGSKLECDVIIGTWYKLDSQEKLPIYLHVASGTIGSLANRYTPAGAQDDNLVHRNVHRFWDAIKRGDKHTVASLIVYPIDVGLSGSTKRLHGPKDLIANYDLIFSPRYREAISNALPRNMFVRGEGIMLGDGEVWFGPDGKVIALNNY